MRKLLLVVLVTNFYNILCAQANRPDLNFGSIKPEDFTPLKYALDTSAAAVYLFDVGVAYFHEDASTHYEEVYKRHARIRILSKNAFDVATLVIPLFNDDEDEQKIEDLQAATYNIINGKIVSEPIDKNSIFKDKNKGVKLIKFTLPDIKEGSIIEFVYTVKTPGISIPGWNFQGKYPKLWSEYEVAIPYFYDYAVLKQGDLHFTLDSTSTYHTEYSYHAFRPDEDNTLQHEWVMQNVPALKHEPFTNTIDNYVSKIEFQLSAYKNSNGQYVAYNRSWNDVSAKLVNSEAFGFKADENKLLANTIKEVTGTATQGIDKAKRIFEYVRDNYTCIDNDTKYKSQEIKKTIQSKRGSVADLNTLLIAMLVNASLTASPLILSTTDNGKINYEYPVLSKYNYTICLLIIDKKQYLLDASRKYLSFGRLEDKCYNGYARVIDIKNSQGVFLSPNSLNESITTTAFIGHNEKKAVIETSLSSQPSIEMKQSGILDQNNYSGKIKELILKEAVVQNVKVNGLPDADSDITITYELPLDLNGENIIYFTPLLSTQIKSNPFPAAVRKYPIELPYCKEEIYRLTMEVPYGYEIEELPKPVQIKSDEDACLFDYEIARSGTAIQINIRVKLAKAIYEPQEYQVLRDFYTNVIKKEAEQIVFKKVK